ncbi:MAG: hypothetical protein JJT89_01740 [Nitriliruptoraceae bacterium]|nr:hypothetical protein [Nitriliruptoraceae bacterium]
MDPRPIPTHRASWDALATEVAQMAATDDPRLAPTVVDLERQFGVELGVADRAPAVLARRFARVHRLGLRSQTSPAIRRDVAAA